MKKLLSFLIFFFYFIAVVAQQEYNFNADLIFVPQKKDASELWFAYIDESPSRDNMHGLVTVKEGKRAMGIRLAIEGIWSEKFYGNLGFDIAGGKGAWNYSLCLGGGYVFQVADKFRVIPHIDFGIGAGRLSLGSLENNSVYIQVNNTTFYDQYVEVALENSFSFFQPGVIGRVQIAEDIGLDIAIDYRMAKTGKGKVSFSGNDENDEGTSAREELSVNNLYLNYYNDAANGIPPPDNFKILKFTGLTFSIGISYTFDRNGSIEKKSNSNSL